MKRNCPNLKQWALPALLILTLAVAVIYFDGRFFAPESALSVHFLSVGKGDCILVIADGRAALIDAGYEDDWEYIRAYLLRLGVRRLDAVIATHPDKDHIGAMADVIGAFSPGVVYLSPADKDSGEYRGMMAAISRTNTPATVPGPGDAFNLGGARITFLAPANDADYEGTNDASVVSLLEYEGVRFLFAGDIERAAEGDLLASGQNLAADVLKVAHHGANSSTRADFIGAVMPLYAVITCENPDDAAPKLLTRLEETGVTVFFTSHSEVIARVKDSSLTVEQ